MSNQQHAIDLLRAQYKQSQDWLNGTLQGVTDELVHEQPAGIVLPMAGQLAHLLSGMDFMILGSAAKQAPLFTSSFAGKAGISEIQPPSGEMLEWGRRVKVNLPALHEYINAVFAGVDGYLASLNDSDLENEVELPFGKFTLAWLFNILILNNYSHIGEISALKGLHGLKGYPM
jgi:hypothetical protein